MDKEKIIELIEHKRGSMSVANAARIAGVSQSGWQRMSKGQIVPTLDMLIVMGAAVGVDIKVAVHGG
jgi:hypothetical protein